VIVDAQARDFFLTATEFGLIDVRWSNQILNEVSRALTNRLGLDTPAVRRLLDVLDHAFPNARAQGFEHLIETIDLPDPDDRHVAAAAIHEECDLLVTENLDDFPDDVVDAFDLLVASIDDAVSHVVGIAPQEMALVVDAILRRLRRPTLSLDEYLQRLSTRAPLGAVVLGVALNVEEYQRILTDITDSENPDSPQEAVRQILAHVTALEAEAAAKVVEPELAERLTGQSAPSAEALLHALSEILSDVAATDDWGFATAKRPLSPDVELVKLVRGGSDPTIMREPTEVAGHLFWLRREASAWVLIDLDGPDPALNENVTERGSQPERKDL